MAGVDFPCIAAIEPQIGGEEELLEWSAFFTSNWNDFYYHSQNNALALVSLQIWD